MLATPVLASWEEIAYGKEGGSPRQLPEGTSFIVPYTHSSPSNSTVYDMEWISAKEYDDRIVCFMRYCLPFDTQFDAQEAFLKAVTVIPAGTYNVKMGFSWGSNVVSGKYYQFTLTQDLPVGGVLRGFIEAPYQSPSNWKVYARSSNTATADTETCAVTEGSSGTNLGTFTAAGSRAEQTVGSLKFKGLNSLHRVAYGNNRYSEAALPQFINGTGTSWWTPKNDFDIAPSYVGYTGLLDGLPASFVESLAPITRKWAISYLCDGGTSAEPVYDTVTAKLWLPSWEEHYFLPTAYYGGHAGSGSEEGDPFGYWKAVAGTDTPLTASTSGNTATYHLEYTQLDLSNKSTARHVFIGSCNRGSGSSVACVLASGYCGDTSASGGYRAVAACAISKS